MLKSHEVTATGLNWLIVSVIFLITSLLCSCWWYAKRQHVSFKTALLVLWNEGIVDGFKGIAQSFRPVVKAAASVTWSHTKRLALALWEYLKPVPRKHEFTPDLLDALYSAVKDYVYAPFQPVINVRYAPYPSAVYVSFYTKSAITDEVAVEVVWHIQAAFQAYLTAYGLVFDYTAIPYVQDNYIEVYLYYAETPAEYPAYRAACRQSMLMKADSTFRPLLESDVPPSADVVLGYRYECWRNSGQIVPIVWDMATAPHALVTGPTGSGKSVYLKSLIEQLLLAGADITICDFKGFGDLRGFVKDYAEGNDCITALMAFCDAFDRDRDAGKRRERRKVLVVDELGSLVASLSKKESDELMRRLSSLIFLCRAYNYSILLSSQRLMASDFPTKLTEQMHLKIYLGASISQQAAAALFTNSSIDKSNRLPPYCGYYSSPKTDCDVLITPKVDIPALDRRLRALGRKVN